MNNLQYMIIKKHEKKIKNTLKYYNYYKFFEEYFIYSNMVIEIKELETFVDHRCDIDIYVHSSKIILKFKIALMFDFDILCEVFNEIYELINNKKSRSKAKFYDSSHGPIFFKIIKIKNNLYSIDNNGHNTEGIIKCFVNGVFLKVLADKMIETLKSLKNRKFTA